MSRRFLIIVSLTWPLGLGVARGEGPTFSKDVAPILLKNCAGCHRPGEVGPFSLLSYKDAAKRADDLADVTASHQMPPWKPEPGFGDFLDERRLTNQEIKTIADWSRAGSPEGDPKDMPPTPTYPEGWQLGKPDLVLEVPAPFDIPASGKDVYRCFVLPIPIDSNKTVAAVEFRPGNRKVVHHALFFLDSNGAARKKDEADDGPGFASFGGPGFLPTGSLGGWAPGAMPRRLPEGMGKMLRKGSDLVLQVHYHPDGKPEADQSMVGIYFTKTPARQIVGGFAVRTRDINIPAGDSRYHRAAESEPLPADAKIIGLTPHMHYVGKEMKAVAETPDGKTIPLIWIKDWDFNWQGQYLYRSPVALAKGTVIKLDAYYDNSSENPRNPSTPPKQVGWGEQTTDEMCILFFQVTTDNPVDLLRFAAMRPGGDTPTKAARPGMRAAQKGAGDGFNIPEALKDRLSRFDKDNDGHLSAAEIESIPEPARERLKTAIRDRMGAGTAKGKP
jgi:hypothetical protein